jgi:hypothetical protein
MIWSATYREDTHELHVFEGPAIRHQFTDIESTDQAMTRLSELGGFYFTSWQEQNWTSWRVEAIQFHMAEPLTNDS